MANLDSEAVFVERALELGLEQSELDVLKVAGWLSYARFAVSCHYSPGQADDLPFLRMAARVTGVGAAEPPENRLPVIRRLFWESFTLAAAEMKARVERREDDAPRRLAAPERTARHNEQQSRLAGIRIEGEREPAFGLIDRLVQMSEENVLRHVAWQDCPKREQELKGRVDPTWRHDSSGIVREVRTSAELKADVSDNLLLKMTLERRALAFDQTSLIGHRRFEAWHSIMLAALLSEPPAGFQRVTIEQLSRADLALFYHMMKSTRNGIRLKPDGTFPLELALDKAMESVEVRLLLQPLMGAASKRKRDDSPDQGSSGSDRSKTMIKQLQNRVANLQSKKPSSSVAASSGPKAPAPKAKGAGKGNQIKLPRELLDLGDCVAKSSTGDSICFAFNLGGCDKGTAGKCAKGLHVCMKRGCGSVAHGRRNHVM